MEKKKKIESHLRLDIIDKEQVTSPFYFTFDKDDIEGAKKVKANYQRLYKDMFIFKIVKVTVTTTEKEVE